MNQPANQIVLLQLMSSNVLKLLDLTYPHTSFFSGKIFNAQIRNMFDDTQIEVGHIPPPPPPLTPLAYQTPPLTPFAYQTPPLTPLASQTTPLIAPLLDQT